MNTIHVQWERGVTSILSGSTLCFIIIVIFSGSVAVVFLTSVKGLQREENVVGDDDSLLIIFSFSFFSYTRRSLAEHKSLVIDFVYSGLCCGPAPPQNSRFFYEYYNRWDSYCFFLNRLLYMLGKRRLLLKKPQSLTLPIIRSGWRRMN